MRTKLACLALALSTTAFTAPLAHAAVPCDDFQIVVNNQLSDDLLGTNIELNGASLEPGGIHKLDSHASQTFTVKKSKEGEPMVGKLVFNTVSLPSKEVKIKFNLSNQGLVCQHDDHTGDNDYSVDKTRLPNKVEYTIASK